MVQIQLYKSKNTSLVDEYLNDTQRNSHDPTQYIEGKSMKFSILRHIIWCLKFFSSFTCISLLIFFKTILHENWLPNKGHSSTPTDIAVIKLAETVQMNEFVSPIDLPHTTETYYDKCCMISGLVT